jgi:hypothetical protein
MLDFISAFFSVIFIIIFGGAILILAFPIVIVIAALVGAFM